MRACRRAQKAHAGRRWLGLGSDGRKRCSGKPDGLTVPRDIAGSDHNRLAEQVKGGFGPVRIYSLGRIEIDSELSLAPLIWSTKGLSESRYFMVLRMPSQSVAPLKATGLRTCPS